MNHIGENIRRIRKAKNMTLADLTGEHVSKGMVSLIENGKTHPTVEKLSHIAAKLDVELEELTERIPKVHLRDAIENCLELLQTDDEEKVSQALEVMKPLMDSLVQSYEGARLYELYARSLFYLYAFSTNGVHHIEENEWQESADKARKIYSNIHMQAKVIRMELFLASVEYLKGDYEKTIELANQHRDFFLIEDDIETKSLYIELEFLKSSAQMALGDSQGALKRLDELLAFSSEHLVLGKFYDLLNSKSLIHYQLGETVLGRNALKKAGNFVSSLDNQTLAFQFQLISCHIQEFYDENYERALLQVDELLDSIRKTTDTDREMLSLAMDLKGRVLTKSGDYQEAVQIFQSYPLDERKNILLSPTDVAMRKVSDSYKAYCYFKLGKSEEARLLAADTVQKMKKLPSSGYQKFAEKVLSIVEIGNYNG